MVCEILDPLPEVDFCVDVADTWEYKMMSMNKYFSQLSILNDIENYLDGISKLEDILLALLGQKPLGDSEGYL